MTVRIRLLGAFEVSVDGVTHTEQAWSRRQAASLVKALALAPRGRLHREQLIDRLWPHLHPETAAPRLHKAAHYARRVLGEGSVVLDRETVSLFPEDPPVADVHEFTERATAAVAATDPELAAEAADLYRGELLPDDRYVEWLEDERERLTRLYVEVLRAAGRWEAILAVDPADEEAHLTLAHRLARAGDRNGALRQFERLERALRQELGVGLSPTAQALRERVLRMPAPAAPPGPERRTGPVVVGRDAQTARTRALLQEVRDGRGRTLFVAGPPGIGKTTLLVHLERQAEQLGMRVGTATAAATAGDWPFAPVLEALADLSRRHPALLDGLDDGMRQEIERALAGRATPWAGANTHQRLFVAAAELLRLAAAGPGALLVVDDVGLADDASLKLLHYLARSTSAEHVLLAFGHRFPPAPALARLRNALLGRSAAVTIDLPPLDLDAATALVRARLPDAPDELVAAWHAATGGSPFELAELVRAVERGEEASPSTLIPPDLPGHVVEALSDAAVLGMRFDTDELQALTGGSDEDTFALVETGLQHRILDRTPGGLRFRHPLLRKALLDRLGPAGCPSPTPTPARRRRWSPWAGHRPGSGGTWSRPRTRSRQSPTCSGRRRRRPRWAPTPTRWPRCPPRGSTPPVSTWRGSSRCAPTCSSPRGTARPATRSARRSPSSPTAPPARTCGWASPARRPSPRTTRPPASRWRAWSPTAAPRTPSSCSPRGCSPTSPGTWPPRTASSRRRAGAWRSAGAERR